MWAIDRAHSSIGFEARHMLVTRVRGQFKEFEAELNIDEQDLTKSSAVITIKAASIDTNEPQRDAHLRSADFFDVEKYPTIRFATKRIEKVGDNRYRIVGDLTIKDVTREVAFDAEVFGPAKNPWGMEVISVSAEAKIDRKEFGLTWNAALEFGGWLVGDEVKLIFEAELVKQPVQEAAKA